MSYAMLYFESQRDEERELWTTLNQTDIQMDRLMLRAPVGAKNVFKLKIFQVNDQQALNGNCYEFVREPEIDMTYSEAKDHCENMNGTLTSEDKINNLTEVRNFCLF